MKSMSFIVALFFLISLTSCYQESGVVINSEPGVFVSIDGNIVGETDANGQLKIDSLESGNYTAVLIKMGYEPVEHDFNYEIGKLIVIEAESFDTEDNMDYSQYEDQDVDSDVNTEEKMSYSVVYETFIDDRDGHEYKYVKIGDQYWMAENLAFIPYDNGQMKEGVWVYDYNENNADAARSTDNYKVYGCLYNWEMATISSPKGWHLPTDEEWKQLEKELGMSQEMVDTEEWRGTDEALKLKYAGSGYWAEDENFSTNESGFSALGAGGYLSKNGEFIELGYTSSWWSADEFSKDRAWQRAIVARNKLVRRYHFYKSSGLSVRCVKDK